MRWGNLDAMAQAINEGADLARVKSSFDEPGQHFQMSYEVKGALPLAIELNMSEDAIILLLDAGAPVPLEPDGRVNENLLFGSSGPQVGWRLGLLNLIESSRARRELHDDAASPVRDNRGSPRL